MKKGFTLIELLAVIVILGLIGMIAIPTINNSTKSYKENLLETQKNNILDAAKDWGADNIYLLPNSANETTINYDDISDGSEYQYLIIKVGLLKENGYIDKDIKNPVTKKEFSDEAKIKIEKKSNKFKYSFVD